MVNEATVRSFLTLARVGSFTEAARRLYLSQQAVSKHMARLEQDLDCTLLNRERGRLTLTEVGEIYYKAFAQMEELLGRAREEAGKKNASRDRALVIGHLELLDVQRFCKDFYRAFLSENPEVCVSYKSLPDYTSLEWLEDGRVDVAFTFENEVQGREGLDYVVIGRLREMLVVSADHPNARDGATYLDFRGESVFYTPVPGDGEDQMLRRMEKMGFPGDRLVEAENILSSCAAVEQLLGITFLTEYCRLLDSPLYRTYPTNQSATLVMAFQRGNKKRTLRRFVEEARRRLAPR